MWLVYDFDAFFEEISAAYVLGSFYPVATSCTTLAERLINLFIIKLRDLYSPTLLSPDLQSYVYSRDQNWQKSGPNSKVLTAWCLLSTEQRRWFEVLLDIRNRAVHFQSTFDPEKDALEAIQTLHRILDSYFSSIKRTDIFRVFEIPGEIWVREDMTNNPFVKAFVNPCCKSWAATGRMDAGEQYFEGDAFVGSYSEEEFIAQRIASNANPSSTFVSLLKTLKLEDGSTIQYSFC